MFTKIKELKIKQLTLELNTLLEEEKRKKLLENIEDIPKQNYGMLSKIFKRENYKEYINNVNQSNETIRKIPENGQSDLTLIPVKQPQNILEKLMQKLTTKRLLQEQQIMLEDKKKRLLAEKEKLNQTTDKRFEEIQKKYHQYEQIMSTKTFSDLGISFNEAVSILHQANQPVILESLDDIENPEKNYKSLQDFILVHRTDRLPTDNKLKAIAEEQKQTIHYPFNGKMYEFPCEGEKISIQYVLNNEIETGTWKDCKYTIMIPFSDVPKEQVGGVSPGNTYTLGGVNLTKNSYILCGKGMSEELKRENPLMALNNIIEWEGEHIEGASKILMKLLGYRVEQPTHLENYDSWKDIESEKMMLAIMQENGYSCKGYTEDAMEKENAMRKLNTMFSLYSGIKNNGLIKSSKDVSNIFEQLQITPYHKEDLKYIDLLWAKLKEENITLAPNIASYISNMIDKEEKELQQWIYADDTTINHAEWKDMLDFTKESFKFHKNKGNSIQNYSVIDYVKDDIITTSVLNAIALNRISEMERNA